MNNLQIFDFKGNNVRTVMIDGEVWFVAKDICDVLGLTNSRQALSGLDDEDKKGVSIDDTLGGKQTMNAINESGLYQLVFASRKPEAKDFKRWVTSEVLPSIRKTGQYSQEGLTNAQLILKQAQELVDLENRQIALQRQQLLQRKRTDKLEQTVSDHDAELERVFNPDGKQFTIRGYASRLGIPISLKEANKLGRKASKLSDKLGYPKDKMPDPRYGEVGTYHQDILDDVFELR